MAFVRSPDHHSIELLQKGDAKTAPGAMEIHAKYRKVVVHEQPPGKVFTPAFCGCR